VKAAADRCPDNLLARSRRAPLSVMERRALDAHLGVCDLCRAAVALGALYDEVPDRPQAGDDALVARLADRLAYGGFRAGLRGWARPTAVAASLVLLAFAGGAAAWISTRRLSPAPVAPSRPTPPAPEHRSRLQARAPATPAGVPASAPPVLAPPEELALPESPAPSESPVPSESPAPRESPATPGRPVVAERRFVRPAAVPLAAEPSASELFATANASRRSRGLRAAVSQYEALQRRYPASEEALVSYVSAGDLLARLGEPSAALAQFDRYLDARASGPLAPEALFGRARSLEVLGRRAAALEAWRDLLRRFPGSIYDRAGRLRVDELSR
jgi:TolA-binding protein